MTWLKEFLRPNWWKGVLTILVAGFTWIFLSVESADRGYIESGSDALFVFVLIITIPLLPISALIAEFFEGKGHPQAEIFLGSMVVVLYYYLLMSTLYAIFVQRLKRSPRLTFVAVVTLFLIVPLLVIGLNLDSYQIKIESFKQSVSCKTEGGKWESGAHGAYCNQLLSYPDRGKPCKDSSGCESEVCIWRGSLAKGKEGESAEGECAKWKSDMWRCGYLLEEGKLKSKPCIVVD